jgi:putative flippase GtrA
VRRGPKRELISRCYNLLLRTALRARFSDAQCGFKAVRSEVARELVPIVADNAWFFDTELLVVAERSGLRLHEVPVDWVDDPDSRVDIWRTAVDDLTGIWRLLRTRPAAIGKLTPPAMARRTEWELGAGQPESPAFLPGRDNVATPPATDYYQTWAARPFLRRGGRPEEACGPRRAASRARKWTRSRFLQFALVGALNTGIAFAVFNMSTAWLGLPAATANVIAWTAGFVNSFVWNRSWTFRDRRELPARTVLMRFAAVNTVALAVSEGVLVSLEALANSVGLTDALGRTLTLNGAEAASIGVALCVNYLLSSRWAFGRPSGALSA